MPYKSPFVRLFPNENPALVVASGVLFCPLLCHLDSLNKALLIFLVTPIACMHPVLFLLSALLGLFYPRFPVKTIDITPLFAPLQKGLEQRIDALYSDDISLFYKTFLLGKSPSNSLSFLFQSLGLSHLLAISGFHFQSILSSFDLLLSRLSKGRLYLSFLILIASGYLLVVQLSSSVLRSFLSLFLTLLAPLCKRFQHPKNTFYLSFILVFLILPEKSFQIGSALSFLATFGILFYSRKINALLESLYVKNSFYLIPRTKNLIKKFFCNLLSLNLAVTLVTLPYILLHIQGFPPLALITNLVFPPLMLPTLFLCILSMFIPFLSPLCSWYTEKILTLMDAIPRPLTFNFYPPEGADPLLKTLLILIVGIAILRSCHKTTDTV
mgnify:CR=1 FL=1